MFNKLISIAVLAFSLGACSNLQSTNPNPRTEIPELPGAKSWGLQLEAVSAHSYEATNDASARPPASRPKLEKSTSFIGGLSYSPLDDLNLALDLDPVRLSWSAAAKYQFLGANFAEKTQGNFSGLFYVRAGIGGYTKKGDQKGEFGPGGYPWKGSISNQFAMTGLSFGYRFNEKAMAYVGNSYGTYSVKTSISQDAANGDAGGSYSFKDGGKADTIGGGLVLTLHNSYLVLGVDYAHVDYNNTAELFDTTYRVGLVLF